MKSDHALQPSALQPLVAQIAKVDGVEQVGKPQLTPDRRAAAVGLVLDTDSTTDRAMDIARGPLPTPRIAPHRRAPT